MMRGTFGNIRLRNQLAPGTEGGFTVHQPSGKQMSIFAASQKYADENVPLIILAGKEYGSGSSRDWAAKGPRLLGVRAVIAESYERIHRSNLLQNGKAELTTVTATSADGSRITFEARVRIDTPQEFEYYCHGGILHYVLRQLAA
jgi:aconitate hydratase